VDAGRVAGGAAGRNGGFLIGGPARFLHDAIAQWGEPAAVGLYRATLAELDRLCERLGDDAVRRVGSLRLAGLPGALHDDSEAADREAEAVDCTHHAAALRQHGIAVEAYDGPLGTGLFLPQDGAVNPAARAIRQAASLRRCAALHEATPVIAVEPGGVLTPLGAVRARVVIVAVDGGLEVLLPELAPSVRSARLQMLATSPGLPPRLPCPVYGRWGFDYGQQTPDGRIYAGGGRDRFAASEWTTEITPTAPVQAWIEQVAARFAGGPIAVTHRWAASGGFTADGRPLCVEVRPGVVACGGYSGTGNLVGPVTARAAVALALDGTVPPAWATSAIPAPRSETSAIPAARSETSGIPAARSETSGTMAE
jgi:gamma-glutamylputrescine oxidase